MDAKYQAIFGVLKAKVAELEQLLEKFELMRSPPAQPPWAVELTRLEAEALLYRLDTSPQHALPFDLLKAYETGVKKLREVT